MRGSEGTWGDGGMIGGGGNWTSCWSWLLGTIPEGFNSFSFALEVNDWNEVDDEDEDEAIDESVVMLSCRLIIVWAEISVNTGRINSRPVIQWIYTQFKV